MKTRFLPFTVSVVIASTLIRWWILRQSFGGDLSTSATLVIVFAVAIVLSPILFWKRPKEK